MLRVMQILLPRVCPDQTVPVQSTLLWSGFRSPEAVPPLASPASLQFLKLLFSNTFSLGLFARLVSVASTQRTS